MCEYCVDGMEDGKGECVCVSNEYVWQNEEKNCVKKSSINCSFLVLKLQLMSIYIFKIAFEGSFERTVKHGFPKF